MDNTYISVAKETLKKAMDDYRTSLTNHSIELIGTQLKEAEKARDLAEEQRKEAEKLKEEAEKARDLAGEQLKKAEEQLASIRKELDAVKANAEAKTNADVKTTMHNAALDIQISQLKQQLALVEQQSTALKEQLKVYETSESLADYPMAAILVRKIVESVVDSGITASNMEEFITQYTAAIEAARMKKATELTQSTPASEAVIEQSNSIGMLVTQLNEQPPKIIPSEQALRLPLMSDEQFNSSFGFGLTNVGNT